jgi:hypothetical protein
LTCTYKEIKMGITYTELLNLDRFMGRDFRKRFFGGKINCLEDQPTEKEIVTVRSIVKNGTTTGTGWKTYAEGLRLQTERPMENSTNPKDKAGQSKPQLHLIPPVANLYEAKVMKSGADKYGPFNWRQDKIATSTYISAIYRHLAAFQDGETYDTDSGMPHMAHIRANTGIVLDAMEQGMAIDDRSNGMAGEVVLGLTRKEVFADPLPSTEPGESMHDYVIRCASIMGIDNAEEFIQEEDYLTGSSEVGLTPPPPALDEAGVKYFEAQEYDTGPFFNRPPIFYIAGPMRGYDSFNFPAFDAATTAGRKLGYGIVSPAELDRDAGFDPATKDVTEEDMRAIIARDVHAILTLKASRGDGIALLPGWKNSIGAAAEVALAKWMGLKIVNTDDFTTHITQGTP